MSVSSFPVIDLPATGANILHLRKDRGLSVRDLQRFFGFEEPQAIYKWQRGQSLPSVDNLFALSALLEVPMNEILVAQPPQIHLYNESGRPEPAALVLFCLGTGGMAAPWNRLDPYPPGSGRARARTGGGDLSAFHLSFLRRREDE